MNLLKLKILLFSFLLSGCILSSYDVTFAQTKKPIDKDPTVFNALRDKDPSVRLEAVRRFGDIRPVTQEVVSALAASLDDKSESVRTEAARILGMIGPDAKKAVSALLKLLADKTEKARLNVVFALSQMAEVSPDVIPGLIRVAEDRNDDLAIRSRAIAALGDIGVVAREAMPALLKLVRGDESKILQIRAWGAIAKIQPDNQAEVAAALVEALEDNSEQVRAEAAGVLGNISPDAKEAVPTLLKVLTNKTEDPGVRGSILFALRRMGLVSADVLPALIQVAEDKDDSWAVRIRAIVVLGYMGAVAREAMPALLKLARGDESKILQIRAWEAIAKIQPDNQEAVRRLVEVAQGKVGKEFDRREDDLFGAHISIARDAFKTLAEIGQIEKVLPILINALQDDQGELRLFAAITFGELGPAAKPAVPMLLQFLQTPSKTKEDDGIKYFVIAALYRIDPASEQVITAFEEIVAHHAEPELRNLAASYLTGMPTQKEPPASR
jgi:HEAT repeat protein